MNKICGIYKITSPSDKIYIGQSRDVYKRIEIYRNVRCKTQTKLYNSLVKYGWLKHKFEIICECDENQLNCLEIAYIKTFNSFNSEQGLNLTSGGHRGNLSEESKEKIGVANKNNKYCVGRILSNITKQKMGNGKRGIKLSSKHIESVVKKIRGNYEIYNNDGELMYEFNDTFESTMKTLNLPSRKFRYSYSVHKKIKNGIYKNWYAIKL